MSDDSPFGKTVDADALGETQSYTLGSPDEQTSGPARAVERGTVVGRYVILGKVGAGGMGVVYAAHDPDLDRKVALKFMHSQLTGSRESRGEEARLMREAQAMAKLSHPNVVTVYDVGTHRDTVWIAMEFVEGGTLRTWLDDKERSWSEIWPVFQGAGRGLQAAHDAKIIHRDFKPDNVLIDASGRARVTDFGLARPTARPEPVGDDLIDSNSELHDNLTRTGAIMGTPRYMAPEQHLGESTDQRTDQFAFCLVLFQALYDQRAFHGDSLAELSRAVTEGKLEQPENRRGIAQWRHSALERGLRVDATERFDSMNALLRALDRNPAARRNNVVVGVVAIAAMAAAVAAFYPTGGANKAAQMCASGAGALAPSWNDAKRARIKTAFANSKSKTADASSQRAAAAIDDYATAWIKMHKDACEETHVLGRQSTEMLDLRMECLDERRTELAALVDVFSDSPNELAVRNSVRSVDSLTPLEGCADRQRLRAVVPRPKDSAKRAAVRAIRWRIDRVDALQKSSRHDLSDPLIPQLMKDARATGYAPVITRVLRAKASSLFFREDYAGAKDALEEAARSAGAGRQDVLAGRIWLGLVQLLGSKMQKPEVALGYVPVAEAALARGRARPIDRAHLHMAASTAFLSKGDYKKALGEAQECLKVTLEHAPNSQYNLMRAHGQLGHVLYVMSDKRAETHLLAAIKFAREGLGRYHEDLISHYTNLGRLYSNQGRWADALAQYRASVEVIETTRGPNSLSGAKANGLVANLLSKLGKFKEADAAIDRLLRGLGWPKPDRVPRKLLGAAVAIKQTVKKHPEARKLAEAALAKATLERGAKHPITGIEHGRVAGVCIEQEDWECVLKHAHAAGGILAKSLPPTHPAQSMAPFYLGSAYIAKERWEKGRVAFQRALDVISKHRVGPFRMALARHNLAHCLFKLGGRHRGMAIKHALAARADYAKAGKVGRANLKSLNDLLVEQKVATPKSK